MAYSTVTLTGTHQLPDGSPAQGTIEIIPSEKLIIDDAGNVILSGRVKVQLDETGSFSVDLPATDDPALTPTGFGYTVAARLHHTHLPAVSFSLPAAVPVVDITDVTTVDPSTFVPDANYVTDAELEAAIGAIPDADPTGLLVVAGGTIDLDDTKDDGYLIGYRLTESTLVEGVAFAAGSYIFERDSSVYGGWTVRTLDSGAQVVPTPDTTAPTAPSLSVDNSGQTQLVAVFSGGTDAFGVTQYRSRIGGGSWTVGTSPRTFTGLTASTSYAIDVQAGDAAGNWSPSTSWTGSTASSVLASPDALTGLVMWHDASDASTFTYSSASRVSQWRDKKNTWHLAQATTTKQPNRTATIGGLAAVKFNPANLERLGGSNPNLVNEFTVFVVCSYDSTTYNRQVVGSSQVEIGLNGTPRWAGSLTPTSTGAVTIGAPTIVIGRWSANAKSIMVDRQAIVSNTNTTARTHQALSLGGFSGDTVHADCTIAEHGVYGRALTDLEMVAVADYLRAKWGIA